MESSTWLLFPLLKGSQRQFRFPAWPPRHDAHACGRNILSGGKETPRLALEVRHWFIYSWSLAGPGQASVQKHPQQRPHCPPGAGQTESVGSCSAMTCLIHLTRLTLFIYTEQKSKCKAPLLQPFSMCLTSTCMIGSV